MADGLPDRLPDGLPDGLTVGGRVVVRYRLADVDRQPAPGGPRVSDVLGTLVEAGPDVVVVTADRDGSTVRLPVRAVVAAKHVPPRPPRRRPRRPSTAG